MTLALQTGMKVVDDAFTALEYEQAEGGTCGEGVVCSRGDT